MTRLPDLLEIILARSRSVDDCYESLAPEDARAMPIRFSIPSFHPRHCNLAGYDLRCRSLTEWLSAETSAKSRTTIVCCRHVGALLDTDGVLDGWPSICRVPSIEGATKTMEYLDELLRTAVPRDTTQIIAIGGGLIMNIAAYIAEQRRSSLVLWPTTILAIADGSGGKVRVNCVRPHRSYKHFYKSFYEPNNIFVDDRFLATLPRREVQCGLCEIIKHGMFQSPRLLRYLETHSAAMLTDYGRLLKAALWAAALKCVCLDVDVEENENGSRRILRAGHNYSDRLEEDERFQVPHGFAVAIGMLMELEDTKRHVEANTLRRLLSAFDIPISLEDYYDSASVGRSAFIAADDAASAIESANGVAARD